MWNSLEKARPRESKPQQISRNIHFPKNVQKTNKETNFIKFKSEISSYERALASYEKSVAILRSIYISCSSFIYLFCLLYFDIREELNFLQVDYPSLQEFEKLNMLSTCISE